MVLAYPNFNQTFLWWGTKAEIVPHRGGTEVQPFYLFITNEQRLFVLIKVGPSRHVCPAQPTGNNPKVLRSKDAQLETDPCSET